MSDDLKYLNMTMIGTNGTGKSTFIYENFIQKPFRKRILIVDPDGLEKLWLKYPKIDINDAKAMSSFTGIRVTECRETNDINIIEQNFNNGMLVLDDFGFYTESNIPRGLRRIFVRRRQKQLDIFAMTHGFTDVPPKFFNWITHLVIFKTLDNPFRHKEKLAKFDEFMEIVTEVNRNADQHYKQILDMKAFVQYEAPTAEDDND